MTALAFALVVALVLKVLTLAVVVVAFVRAGARPARAAGMAHRRMLAGLASRFSLSKDGGEWAQ